MRNLRDRPLLTETLPGVLVVLLQARVVVNIGVDARLRCYFWSVKFPRIAAKYQITYLHKT